jgi:hypothetical protein
MKPMTAERLRALAERCVTGANRTSDEDAAAILLDVAASLTDLANGKVDSRKAVEPAFNRPIVEVGSSTCVLGVVTESSMD